MGWVAGRVYQMEGKAAKKAQRWETTRYMLGRTEPEGNEFRRLGRALNASPRRKESSAIVWLLWSHKGSPGGGGCALWGDTQALHAQTRRLPSRVTLPISPGA